MTIGHRLRSAAVLTLAVAGPPTLVWTGSAILRASSATPVPARVEHFADYIGTAEPAPASALSAGNVIWTGTPGEGAPFFSDMRVAGRSLVLVSASRFVAIDTNELRVVSDVSVSDSETLANSGAWGITPADHERQVWLYNPESGKFRLFDFSNGFEFVRGFRVAPSLRSLTWLKGRLITNGPFESELIRIYEEARPAGGAPQTPESLADWRVARTVGRPLIPGLHKMFSLHLNSTFLAVSSDGAKAAVGYQWTSRLDIYNLNTLSLERSLSGPVPTKLDFAVAGTKDTPILTLGDDTEWSYVDVAVTDDVVLALYAGRVRRKFGSGFSLGTELHAFTWDGRPVGQWRLAEPLQRIEIGGDPRVLFGLRKKPHSVVSIELAPVVDAARRLSASRTN